MRPRLFGALCCALALGGCADASRATPEDAVPRVVIEHISFSPETIEVGVGEEVVWTNRDAEVKHTITSGRPGDAGVPGLDNGKPNRPDGAFDGIVRDTGETFTHTFSETGTFRYFCRVHPVMTGVVRVSD